MRKITSIVVGPMNLLGLNPLKRDTFLNCYVPIFLSLAAFVYGIYGTTLFMYHWNKDFYNFAVPVAFASSLITCIITVLTAQMCKPTIHYVLSSIDNHVFKYPDEENFILEYKGYTSENNYTKLSVLVLLLEIAGFTVASISPFMGYFFTGRLRTFLYPQWVQWNIDSKFSYTVTYMLQLPVVVSVFLIFYVVQLYFTFVLVEFLGQYQKLQYAVETLNERSSEKLLRVNDGPPSVRDDIFKSELIMCIHHHQKLCK